MENKVENCIESDILRVMPKANKDHQVNIRISEEDLAYIDAKAKRYGMNRSSLVKYLALNGEFTVVMQEQLKKPQF
jgi:predicted DNA binding CopG/RHH family protein